MSDMQPSSLTLAEIKELITFCKQNNVNYLEYQTLKFNLLPEVAEIKQPSMEELMFGNFDSWTGTPRDSK